jgi:hypothetical protein
MGRMTGAVQVWSAADGYPGDGCTENSKKKTISGIITGE